MSFREVNGVMLHARAGKGTGRALVFVNSLGTDFRIWHRVAHELRPAGMRFLFHDKRGHGLSDVGEPPYSMQDHVNDLAELMDMHDMRQAIVCGISVGGMIALGLARARPDLVAGLVICGSAHKIGTRQAWDARIATVASSGLARIWPTIEAAWFTQDYRERHAADVRGWRNMVMRCPVGGYIGTCMAIRDADYTDAARDIDVPTRVLAAAQDGSTPPEVVQSLADIVPGAEYHIIENAAHMMCIEQPQEVARHIRAFATTHGLA